MMYVIVVGMVATVVVVGGGVGAVHDVVDVAIGVGAVARRCG